MGESTAIAWTDHTFNPWWGCERVSPGCQHCYAETFAKRTGHDVWGKGAEHRFFGDKHWNEPLRWAAKADASSVRRRVFCASMADVFQDRPDLVEPRARLFDLIETTDSLDWQLLTKRPQNVAGMVPPEWLDGYWPRNAWLGTTVEDQERAEERIPALLAVPAAVRFLSCEPLLSRVSFRWAAWVPFSRTERTWHLDGLKGIHWVIVGGESGPGHRALDLDDARTIRDECRQAEVPFFFKQVGGRSPTAGGDQLDAETSKEFPRVKEAA